MTIKHFDKQNLAHLRTRIQAALDTVADDNGISLKLGSIGFDATNFKATVTGSTVNESGEVETPELAALKQHGKIFLGDNFDVDKTYTVNGEEIKFVGIKSRGQKYPIIYKKVSSGAQYKTTIEHAKFIIGKVA